MNTYSFQKQVNPARVVNNHTQRWLLGFEDNKASSLSQRKLVESIQRSRLIPAGIIQRKLNIEGKDIRLIEPWVERTESAEVIQILVQWINSGDHSYKNWIEAIEAAKTAMSALNDETSQDSVINAVIENFSERITISDFTFDSQAQAKDKAMAFGSFLGNLQSEIQAFVDRIAPGRYKSLARFYVADQQADVKHPGLNSWAFLNKDLATTGLDNTELSKMAAQHMAYGHESGSTIKNSPFVSTTEDIQDLIRADSPQGLFQQSDNSSVPGARPRPKVPNSSRLGASPLSRPCPLPRPSLLSQTSMISEETDLLDSSTSSEQISSLRPPAVTPAIKLIPQSDGSFQIDGKDIAMGTSPIITNLLYGYQSTPQYEKRPVATHVAFLVVPIHRTVLPPKRIYPESCCIREKEVVVYAPDVSLSRWFVGCVYNVFPELTGGMR